MHIKDHNIKIIDLKLPKQVDIQSGLPGYARIKCLLRLRGTPVGWLDLPVWEDRIREQEIYGSQFERNWTWILHEVLLTGLLMHDLSLARFSALLDVEPGIDESGSWSPLTVAVCTRNRKRELARCLGAISRLRYPDIEVIVVDNASSGDETQRLVTKRYPHYRCSREDRPGLDWARIRAIGFKTFTIVSYFVIFLALFYHLATSCFRVWVVLNSTVKGASDGFSIVFYGYLNFGAKFRK